MSGPNHPRGTTNRNQRGGTEARRRRREWLVATYRADVDLCRGQLQHYVNGYFHSSSEGMFEVEFGTGEPACRCYRCGVLLTVDTVTADRIKPGCKGGTYVRTNLRPACLSCNAIEGVRLRESLKARRVTA